MSHHDEMQTQEHGEEGVVEETLSEPAETVGDAGESAPEEDAAAEEQDPVEAGEDSDEVIEVIVPGEASDSEEEEEEEVVVADEPEPEPLTSKKPSRGVDPAQLRVLQEQLGASLRSAREEAAAAEEKVAELEAKLSAQTDAFDTEREDLRNKMMRAVADRDNYRKRAEREKEEAKLYSAKPLVSDLLQAVDNLERALAHAERTEEESSIFEGVRMVHRQIVTALDRNGVKGFDSLGDQFDPQRHEAVQQRDSDEHATGTIVEEFMRGYYLHDRLLRAALVVVARYTGVGEPPSADEAATLSDAAAPPAPEPTDPARESEVEVEVSEASDPSLGDEPSGAQA